MHKRGSLYVGLILMGFGAFFLLAQLSNGFGGFMGRMLGWGGLWPLLILLVAACFWLPLAVWWDRRAELAGLAVPGTIVGVNGLLLLYQNWSGDWSSWAYAWALEPMAVGLSLLVLYWLSDNRPHGLLVAAGIVGGIGAVFFVIFASAFGGVMRYLGPVFLIVLGTLVVIRGLSQRAAQARRGQFD